MSNTDYGIADAPVETEESPSEPATTREERLAAVAALLRKQHIGLDDRIHALSTGMHELVQILREESTHA